MTMRKISSILGATAAAALLAACPGYEQEERPVADVPVTEVGPAGMTRDTAQALPMPERVTVEGEGIAVEAVLSPVNGSTHVVLQVRQAPPNASLQGALHSGRCAAPGEQVAPLGTVATDAAGTGRGEAHLDIPGHLVFDGQHHVQVQGGAPAPAGAGAMAACGDIPARAVPRLEEGPPQAPAQTNRP
jgi:hypothetical protein